MHFYVLLKSQNLSYVDNFAKFSGKEIVIYSSENINIKFNSKLWTPQSW